MTQPDARSSSSRLIQGASQRRSMSKAHLATICVGTIGVATLLFADQWIGSIVLALAAGAIVMKIRRSAQQPWVVDGIIAVATSWTAGSTLWLTLSHVWRHIARFL